MKIIQGGIFDLVAEGKFDVIIHGCNCFCTMGAGIAKTVKQLYPEAYAADCKTRMADLGKLGTYSSVYVPRRNKNSICHDPTLRAIAIVNGYTQFDYGRDGRRADYKAIHSVFKRVKQEFSGKVIAYPKIGAGLARGNWHTIAEIIDEELAGEEHYLVLLPE